MQAYRLKDRVEITPRLAFEPGTIVFDFLGPTYGCCTPEEVPVSKEPHEGPFVGVSRGSLEPVGHFHPPTAVRRLKEALGPTGRKKKPLPNIQNVPAPLFAQYRNYLFSEWLAKLCDEMGIDSTKVDPFEALEQAGNHVENLGGSVMIGTTKDGENTVVRVPMQYAEEFERFIKDLLSNL
jgi:hypothetical protein